MRVGRGVTRAVYTFGAGKVIKIPRRGFLIRGWMANQSEWRQRNRPDVARPVTSLAHVGLVVPQARDILDRRIALGASRVALYQQTGIELAGPDDDPFVAAVRDRRYGGDEAKPSSWGLLPEGWRLIDFDRAWEAPYRGVVCRVYYWNQNRLGRKWSKL